MQNSQQSGSVFDANLQLSAKLIGDGKLSEIAGYTACTLCFLSLLASLKIIIPRGTLARTFGNGVQYASGYKPVSFYGYVAAEYPKGRAMKFYEDVDAMDAETFAREALEQHYAISHVLSKKEYWVGVSGRLLQFALLSTAVGVILKFNAC